MSAIGNQAAWSSVVDGLVYNEQTAIAAYWRDLKSAGQYVGVPVSDEMDDGEGGRVMAFSSGAIIRWHPDTGATLE
jgi:uncharacterized protein with LGFP repeats